MMKDLHLALPPGMSVNPSSADGLAACTEAQAHFHSLTPGQCPDDSKLGPVERSPRCSITRSQERCIWPSR